MQSLLRYASIAISAIVLISFAMFISDQSESGSAKEVATLSSEGPGTAQQQPGAPAPKPAAKPHGQPRKAIDDADKTILSPFDGLVSQSSGKWARKGVPSLLALLVFGFGLNLLAGYLPKPKPSV
ncbi:MAG: hypothetical protein ACJ77M_07565 [Thermoleophilaceae bacterium]|jgi:hypothetical protein